MEDDLAQWIVPFFSIWIFPRATIRRIVEANPRKFVTGLGWITGALGALVFEVQASNSAALTSIPRWAVAMGPVTLAMSAFTLGLAGVGIIYALAFVFHWAGNLVGGVADLLEVRAAVAWSWIPLIVLAIVAVIAAISAPAANSWTASTTPDPYQIPYSCMAEAALFVWAVFIATQTLGEVHRLSPRRAAGMLAVGTIAITFVALGGFIITTTLSMVIHLIV
ncbi:MAG: Yip1 family protein [Candidatus Binataceae bacterium]